MNKYPTPNTQHRSLRILIVNPFGIGDVLFTGPLIESIKAASAETRIGYICNIRTAPLVLSNPNVNKVFIFEKDEYRSIWKISKTKCLFKLMNFLKEIKAMAFNMVFDLSLAQEFGFFLMLCGIKERIGYNYRDRGIFLTKKIPLAGGYCDMHMADYYLRLLSLIGMPAVSSPSLKIYITEEDMAKAKGLMINHGIAAGERLVCIVPGGGQSWGDISFRKQWPVENFLMLSSFLCAQPRLKVILLGGSDDIPICDYIKEKERRCINLCGKTDLLTLAAVMRICGFVVTNDGGPLHIAVASRAKTVSIFGPVDDRVYGPYPRTNDHIVIKDDKLACRPCYKAFKLPACAHRDCLNKISAEGVIRRLKNISERPVP
jgi:ADP-heptose:LPS heptosyltransferase